MEATALGVQDHQGFFQDRRHEYMQQRVALGQWQQGDGLGGYLRDEREEPEASELRHLLLQVANIPEQEPQRLDHEPHRQEQRRQHPVCGVHFQVIFLRDHQRENHGAPKERKLYIEIQQHLQRQARGNFCVGDREFGANLLLLVEQVSRLGEKPPAACAEFRLILGRGGSIGRYGRARTYAHMLLR